MGCDIHMSYQRISKSFKREKVISNIISQPLDCEEDWEFIDFQFSEENRNYYWFGRMSNVRGEGPRITLEGYPPGNYDNYYYDTHSHSYVYLERLLNEEWSDIDNAKMSVFINEDIPKMKSYCDSNKLGYNEFRILMSYDS